MRTRAQLWSWSGVVAVILAFGVSLSLVLLACNAMLHGGLEEPVTTILSSSLGAAIGAVGGYIGGVKRSPDDDEPAG